jgi:hypothetical protein
MIILDFPNKVLENKNKVKYKSIDKKNKNRNNSHIEFMFQEILQ